ncbi:MAG: F0F1 ATP synthase subunit A [bacterium]|nr:F0F1 ATP synthase subunit A [bacterium]
MSEPHISLAAETIETVFGLPITNSLLMTWLVMAGLIALSLVSSRRISLVPGNVQSVLEIVIEGLYELFRSVVGVVYVDKFFPLLATLFFFIVVSNWSGLLPGVGNSIGFLEEESHVIIPLLRGPTADLNTTFALAIVSVISIQYFGVRSLGGSYFKKFINMTNPIMFGVGLLEIVSELSRIISFAFRLFGNIFAGEVLLVVMASLMPLLAPLPFLGLELFVGLIQGLVFSMLTAVFLNMATISHEEHS